MQFQAQKAGLLLGALAPQVLCPLRATLRKRASLWLTGSNVRKQIAQLEWDFCTC